MITTAYIVETIGKRIDGYSYPNSLLLKDTVILCFIHSGEGVHTLLTI